MARDVTRIRAIQKRLAERERLAILGTFAGGIAHDLNNLLLPIRGGLDGIEKANDLDHVRSRVQAVRRATDHIAELTRKILMWTRHDSIGDPFSPTRTPLSPCPIPQHHLPRFPSRNGG